MLASPTRLDLAARIGHIATALAVGGILCVLLAWLLARLVWIWFFFGVFFYLIGALLIGAVVFPLLRPLRPLPRWGLFSIAIGLATASWGASICWESRYVAATVGNVPKFADARAALLKAGRNPDEIFHLAQNAFVERLREEHAGCGPIAYARWCIQSGKMDLTLAGLNLPGNPEFTDHVTTDHRGKGWILRAAAAFALLLVGLWWQFASLCSSTPVSNLIDPDEADELEREELREAGEPGWTLFEHTADVGLEARGKDWQGLLEQAAFGLMGCIGRLVPDTQTKVDVIHIALTATTREDLLHDWLSELLYYFETREIMIEKIKFRAVTDMSVKADVHVRRIDRSASNFLREVKAVTYHELAITPIKRGLSARVILDI